MTSKIPDEKITIQISAEVTKVLNQFSELDISDKTVLSTKLFPIFMKSYQEGIKIGEENMLRNIKEMDVHKILLKSEVWFLFNVLLCQKLGETIIKELQGDKTE